MPYLERTSYCTTLAVLAVLAFLASGCATASIAVKRGQQAVDPGELPFAAFTIATDGVAFPLEKLVLEDCDHSREITVQIGQLFNASHPDVLTAREGDHRSLSLVILKLTPGRYRIKGIEFTPCVSRGVATCSLDMTDVHAFAFTLKPNAVSYFGSLVVSADWSSIRVNQGLSATYVREETQFRDQKWARM